MRLPRSALPPRAAGILYPPHPLTASLSPSPYLYSELGEVAKRTGLGFVVMGFIGYFVKLILYARPPSLFPWRFPPCVRSKPPGFYRLAMQHPD